MKQFNSILQWQNENLDKKSSLGFVPTMGALHEGHTSLVQRSLKENGSTLVSIFLNPTQFNNASDLETYPSHLEKDLEILRSLGVTYVLTPNYEELYPDNYNFKITESTLSQGLCGKHRPGHFDGVLTVVMKLLNITSADRAYFGEKDYQQYLLIKNMAEAFFLKTEIISCPTVRDSDHLALSSRNEKLTPEQRVLAPELFQALTQSESTSEALTRLKDLGFTPDYVEDYEGRRFGAASLGQVRLIDNVEI